MEEKKVSQLELTDRIAELANSVKGEGIDLIIGLGNKVYDSLKFRPYIDETKEEERKIRWKRTADQILKDGFVYEGKACTDIVVVFLAFARARNIEAKFVKIHKGKMVHSVAEIKIKGEWCIYDVAIKNTHPEKGEFVEGVKINGWKLWKKGRDAWSLDLKNYEDIQKIR